MATQREIWKQEHTEPSTFVRLHTDKPSAPIPLLIQLLEKENFVPRNTNIIDICCGKGRNSIHLAQSGYQVTAVDFASPAIDEAKTRASGQNIKVNFSEFDVTEKWEFPDSSFDVVIDCNGTICIPNPGRESALKEALRVLKRGGYYLFYGVGPSELLERYPGPEPNSGIFPITGKFEKQYPEEELLETYRDFEVVTLTSIPGEDVIDGKLTKYSMWVAIFRKP